MQEPMKTNQTDAEDWLSALIDGELDEPESAERIRRLARDETLQARWSEYCLIGDALRGLPPGSDRLPARLRTALDQEPTVLAPVTKPMRQQPALWLAAAATVAAVTWLVLQAAPRDELPVQMAAQTAGHPSLAQPAGVDVSVYLAAHQDYAQALTSTADMQFTQMALSLEAAR